MTSTPEKPHMQPPSVERPPNVQNAEGLWFQDGNIILIVENTGFRFHKCVLARYSVAFESVFTPEMDIDSPACPPHTTAQDEIDGVPIVVLQGLGG